MVLLPEPWEGMNMNPLWKVYKSKVLKTLNPDLKEDPVEEQSNEVDSDLTSVQQEEGPTAMSQLAKRMQGAGAKGWRSMSALFNKDDEHQLLESESHPAADHPLAAKPEEPRPSKKNTGFWDSFATKWQQAAAMRQAETTEGGGGSREEAGSEGVGQSQEGDETAGGCEGGGESSGNSFSKYATLEGGGEETPFKWNFVTSKLAELKSRSLAKSN
ncbi:testis development-related protein-like [Arapaima gigas]